MKKIRLLLIVLGITVCLLITNLVAVAAEGEISVKEEGLWHKIKEVYQPNQEAESRQVPFVYYINEAGLMVGDFYYDTNLFDNQTELTTVLLYAPENTTFTSMTEIKDYPLSDKWKLGGSLKVIKYNDIKNGAIGNDSSNEEIPESYFEAIKNGNFGSIDLNKLDGYRTYYGWNNSFALNLTYEFDEHNNVITEYNYEELESQVSDYKSDTISVAWENKRLDNKNNPRDGHKVITKVKKSLDMLSHDSENNWDYTKLTLDARKYIPVFEQSTLALRFRTQSTLGEKRLDEERTKLLKLQGSTESVYTYAPFFDMALLGDLNTMRGYRYYRFYDNNSVLYQAELRFPLDNMLSGLQGTVFAEAGRVGSDFDTDLFTQDMHYSGGLGARYFFNDDIVVRSDIGYSEEGVQVRMNIGQTF